MRLLLHPPVATRRGFLASSLSALAIPSTLSAAKNFRAASGDVPWLEEVQTPPKKLLAPQPKLQPLLVQKDGSPITTVVAWQKRRREIRQWWLDFLHPLRRNPQTPPPLTVLSEDRLEGVIRQLVRYEVEPGIVTEAYLLKPDKISQPRPGVAVFHSTIEHSIRQPAGVQGRPEKAFGLQLAKQGYVAFCPRNYLWPNNHEIVAKQETEKNRSRHPKSKGMAKMLHDSLVAVDILAGLPEVDGSRLGSLGHSLGAKEVLYLAALDERIQVTVSSEGGIGTKFSNWNAPWYLGPEIDKNTFTRRHHELLSLVAPRAFLLVGGNSADGDQSWPYIEATLPVYRLYEKKARLGLFNHRQGHRVPPIAEKRIYQWIKAYL